MSETKYTPDHEWVKLEDGIITVGVTDYAQSQLGDIVYIELPETGSTVDQGEEIVVVESVKAAGDVKAPVTGEIVEVNDALNNEPEIVNADPENEGWLFKMKALEYDQFSQLHDEKTYQDLVASLS